MTTLSLGPTCLAELGWQHLCAALAERARTPMAKRRALSLAPLPNRETIEDSLAQIEEMRALARHERPLPLAEVEDVGAALTRASKESVLDPGELASCAVLMRAASAVRRFLTREVLLAPRLAVLGARLPALDGLAARIEASVDPSGEIRDEASDELGRRRRHVRAIQKQLQERLQSMLRDPAHAQYLQDTYVSIRNDRYVLPVNASFRNQVPGIVHNASQSGQTLFTEPSELVPLGNDLAIAQSLVVEEERRILAELSSDVGAKYDVLVDALAVLGELDLVRASAHLADALGAQVPTLGESTAALRLRGLRHPRLLLQGGSVVPNDVELAAPHRALVISGPNAGGKTVTLTAVGLCTLMVHAGLPIPCDEGSELPLFSVLGSTLGDAQDLRTHQSTFSAHITRLAELLAQARPGALALIDEIAADTDPTEGAAIARAVLEALIARGAQVLVTTHLEDLKALGVTDERFLNARVGLDGETQAPTYRLQLGYAGASNAIELAQRVGLPEDVVGAAREYLQEGGALSVALGELARQREQLTAAEQAIATERQALTHERARVVRTLQEAEHEHREAEVRVREELREELLESRRTVGVLIAKLQAQPRLDAAQRAQSVIDREVGELDAKTARLRNAPRVASGLPIAPGVWVTVLSLGQRAQVRSVDGQAALVTMGSVHTRVPLADLAALPAGEQHAASAKPRRPRATPPPSAQAGAQVLDAPEARCDLRGERVDEALKQLGAFIDRALLDGPTVLLVIHGHGTGVLKEAVRRELASLSHVASIRPGGDHEGGDGVTIVELA